MAVATPEYSLWYVAAEAEARDNQRGLWQGSFQLPSEFRQQRRR